MLAETNTAFLVILIRFISSPSLLLYIGFFLTYKLCVASNFNVEPEACRHLRCADWRSCTCTRHAHIAHIMCMWNPVVFFLHFYQNALKSKLKKFDGWNRITRRQGYEAILELCYEGALHASRPTNLFNMIYVCVCRTKREYYDMTRLAECRGLSCLLCILIIRTFLLCSTCCPCLCMS